MQILVHIQVPSDGRELFEAYEAHVLPLLKRHGCELTHRHVSASGEEEFHIITAPNVNALKAFEADPDRISAQPLWEQSDATSRKVTLA